MVEYTRKGRDATAHLKTASDARATARAEKSGLKGKAYQPIEGDYQNQGKPARKAVHRNRRKGLDDATDAYPEGGELEDDGGRESGRGRY